MSYDKELIVDSLLERQHEESASRNEVRTDQWWMNPRMYQAIADELNATAENVLESAKLEAYEQVIDGIAGELDSSDYCRDCVKETLDKFREAGWEES